MKRIAITLGFAVLSIGVFAQSEGFRAGTRVGIGNAVFKSENTPYSDDIDNQIGKIAFQAGVSAGYQFFPGFGLEIDGLLHFRGAKYTGSTSTGTLGGQEDFTQIARTLYVDVPFLAKFSVGTSDFRVKGYTGPNVGFLIYAEEEREFNDPQVNRNNGYIRDVNSLNTQTFGWVYGIGLETEGDGGSVFYVDFRVQEDLQNSGTYGGVNVRQRVVGLSVGSKFKR